MYFIAFLNGGETVISEHFDRDALVRAVKLLHMTGNVILCVWFEPKGE